jgi:hypothetical protein
MPSLGVPLNDSMFSQVLDRASRAPVEDYHCSACCYTPSDLPGALGLQDCGNHLALPLPCRVLHIPGRQGQQQEVVAATCPLQLGASRCVPDQVP